MRTDEDLTRSFQDGDDLAFAGLYNRHKLPLYVFCLKMVGAPEAAQDIVQEAFLRAYERRRQLASPGKFKTWLLAIGRNLCLTHLRRSRGEVGLTGEEEQEEEQEGEPGPLMALEAEEEVVLVNRAIATLKPEYREVILLREFQDLSYREIAEVTAATESSVKARIFKARRRLSEMLRPRFAERSEP